MGWILYEFRMKPDFSLEPLYSKPPGVTIGPDGQLYLNVSALKLVGAVQMCNVEMYFNRRRRQIGFLFPKEPTLHSLRIRPGAVTTTRRMSGRSFMQRFGITLPKKRQRLTPSVEKGMLVISLPRKWK